MHDGATGYCPTCRTTKPLDDFPREKRSRTGRAKVCTACAQARRRRNRPTGIRHPVHGGAR